MSIKQISSSLESPSGRSRLAGTRPSEGVGFRCRPDHPDRELQWSSGYLNIIHKLINAGYMIAATCRGRRINRPLGLWRESERHREIGWCSRSMMASGHGNAVRITGPLWGETTDNRWIPLTEGPAMRKFYDFIVVRLNKLLKRQSKFPRFETQWRIYDIIVMDWIEPEKHNHKAWWRFCNFTVMCNSCAL